MRVTRALPATTNCSGAVSSYLRDGFQGGAVLRPEIVHAGAQFLDAADRAILIILEAPDRWSIIEADVRRYLMSRFPFAIYYRVLPDQIRNLAFKHHSRHPDYWRYRLSE
jgi:hypothetical protein